jgi:predicted NBD/HSP70 family sugar kinase
MNEGDQVSPAWRLRRPLPEGAAGMSSSRDEGPFHLGMAHGAGRLPSVIVEAYNVELRDGDGFVGDRASNRAFREIVESWRARMRKIGDDPLGDTPTSELGKKKLDKVLVEGDPEAAGLIQGAVEQFASELAAVVQRLLKLKAWSDAKRIVVGGGLRASRIGELAIGRASVALKTGGLDVELKPIRHDPDEGGLVGAVHLVPAWMFEGHDGILAVDVGGSNIRAGIVVPDETKPGRLGGAHVHELELWCYAEERTKPTRETAVEHMLGMLAKLVKRADKDKVHLAPFIGLACPGVIAPDGHIERGGQNLPGNWESNRFNLPREICERLPKIGKHPTTVVMHNDAVVQGLSEVPFIQDVEHWGVLTIGTGLGNAAFANVRDEPAGRSRAAHAG